MADLYVLVEAGPPPVSAAELEVYLKLEGAAAEDSRPLLSLLLEAATRFAESYTRRDFRANRWRLHLDEFPSCDRVSIRRDPVDSIVSITYLVETVQTTLAAATYYLKRKVQTSEVVLAEDAIWPTDADAREGSIEITFLTKAHERWLPEAKLAIMRIAAYLFENRGECGDLTSTFEGSLSTDAVKSSGAFAILNQFRVSRI